ncbi:transposase family protein [Actinomyces denticolens]|uniref:transposase family protein n=1 Tax=Actinomyces TaxID=1654 RepID=UPI0035314ECD
MQAVMVLRWLIEATSMRTLARDARISPATAYRYLHEALQVISSQAPDLIEVITQLRHKGEPFVCLDGTLIRTDPVAARTERGNHSWYAGLAQGPHAATSRSSPTLAGLPVWVWPVEPGSAHDLTAARAHALPALYKAASQGMPTLADKGYIGAGIGVLTPVKGTSPCPDDATYNHLHASLRSPAERANTMLKHLKALQHVTPRPAHHHPHHRHSPRHHQPQQTTPVRKTQ